MSEIESLSPAAAVSMADEWFELAAADHFWMQWRHQILVRELKHVNRPIRNALEIGCGNGIVREMVERDLNIPVDGCDLNPRALEMAARGRGRLLLYNIFDRNPELLRAYDLVLLMDVIEHLDDDLAFLRASLEHLKVGGLVAINVPAHMAFYGRYDEVAGHKRRYNRPGIESLFRRAGVNPIRIVYWGFSLVPVLFARNIVLRFVSRDQTIRVGFAEQNFIMRHFLDLIRLVETRSAFPIPVGSSLFALGTLEGV